MIRKIIKIDEKKCNGCGACASACLNTNSPFLKEHNFACKQFNILDISLSFTPENNCERLNISIYFSKKSSFVVKTTDMFHLLHYTPIATLQ